MSQPEKRILTPDEEEDLAFRWAVRLGYGIAALGILLGAVGIIDPLILTFLVMTGIMMVSSKALRHHDIRPYM